MTFTTVTVVRDYDLANGVSPVGRVGFTPTTSMSNAGKTVVAATVWAPLDVDGKIAQALQANTDPTTTPTGVSYLVAEQINNVVFQYYVRIPHDQGSTVDLSTLLTIPVTTPPPITYPAPGPAGPAGPQGPTGTAPNALQVLVYSGGAYPARPSGLAGGQVRYIGPTQPTDWTVNDEWINNS